MIRPVIFLVFVLQTLPGLAQKDSVKAAKKAPVVWHYSKEEFERGIARVGPDTLLDGFQRYTQRNNIGNNGLPVFGQKADTLPDLGFNYYRMPISFTGFSKGSGIYYTTRSPYTDVFVAAGAKKEAMFKLLHTQNVNKALNFALGFQRIRSEGFYLRENTNDNSFFISSNYRPKKNKYNLLAQLVYNSFNYSTNGGIANDTTFEDGSSLDKKLIPVNLSAAQRRERNKSATLSQYFHLAYFPVPADLRDSTAKPQPRRTLFHTFSISDASWVYEDNDPQSGFYGNVLNDTVRTLDSAYTWKIENSLHYRAALSKDPEGSSFQVSVKHEFGGLMYDTAFSNLMAAIDFTAVEKKAGLHMNIRGQYCFSGTNAGDANIGLFFRKSIAKASAVIVEGKGKMVSPWFMMQRYAGNHFVWAYDFEKTSQMEMRMELRNNKYRMGIAGQMNNFVNYTYFDNFGAPKQMTTSFVTYTGILWKDFTWKKLRFNNKVIYQYVPDSIPLRLPEIVSKHSLFFEKNLFKSALILQAGVDVFFSTAWYSPMYMPATGAFCIQNEKKTGNYPFADVFVNMKIKTVFIFLKMEHANSGLMGNTYYSLLHYPAPDRALKFGLRWRFLD